MMVQTAKETWHSWFLQAAKRHTTALKAALQSTCRCPQHALRHAMFLYGSVLFCLLYFLFLGTLCGGLTTMCRDHSAQRSLPSAYYERSLVSYQDGISNGQGLARPSSSPVSHVCSGDLLQRGKRKNQGNSSESPPPQRRALGSSSCRFS